MLVLLAPTLGALDKDALRQAISGPDREVTDFMRDQARKPVEVLDFLGIEPGMQVLDLYAAGGYYSFILSRAVGPTGTVYAQNTERGMRFKEDRQEITQGEALMMKIERGRLDNVEVVVAPLRATGIPQGSLDAALIMQTLHDYYNPSNERALQMLLQVKALLKPGGVIGISDHVGLAGNDNRDLHRMEIEDAVAVAERAGFLVERSELLRNPDDDHRRSIFEPRLGRNTDRFLLKLIKPGG